jgi:nicotinamide-nucleotide adenylyltransferase
VSLPPFGFVHGRFQPPHNEHLHYWKLALGLCETLLIGITNFDPELIVEEEKSPDRHKPSANPFSYWERTLMIRDTLLDEGVEPERFAVVAFPIHHPERWSHYAPAPPSECLYILRVFSDWEAEKARRFARAGLKVQIIREPRKLLSGHEVRQAIAEGRDWEKLVPAAVARHIKALRGETRIRRLMEDS